MFKRAKMYLRQFEFWRKPEPSLRKPEVKRQPEHALKTYLRQLGFWRKPEAKRQREHAGPGSTCPQCGNIKDTYARVCSECLDNNRHEQYRRRGVDIGS